MKERAVVARAVGETERLLGTTAFAYKANNSIGTHPYWAVCVDDFTKYYSREGRQLFARLREESRPLRIIFFHLPATESRLLSLANDDNLILNI